MDVTPTLQANLLTATKTMFLPTFGTNHRRSCCWQQPTKLAAIVVTSLLVLYLIATTTTHLAEARPPQFPLSQQQQSQNNPYTNATHAILLNLRQQLITRAMIFDDHFRTLLTQSKLSLHNMFVATYGMMYEHNTEIFTTMYESLEQYYATGQIELSKSMETFFQRLYQKIFQVANSNRAFPPAYLECVTEQLTHLKPFEDAPDKLILDIRHALVAARTFNQALNQAIDIIKSIISLGDPPQCINLINGKLLRNQQQPAGGTTRELLGSNLGLGQTSNLAKQPPCLPFCEQVILRCVGRNNLEPLSDRWRNYVSSLSDLAKKLVSQYDIVRIIGPIDVQISDAIMNFQDNAPNITERVYAACGDVKPNNGMQPAQSSVPAMRVPSHNLGKRDAAAPRLPTSIGSPNSFERRSQNYQASQTINTRRNLQPIGASSRQTDRPPHSIVPASVASYDPNAMTPARIFTSANHMTIGGYHHQSGSKTSPDQSIASSLVPFDKDGSPLTSIGKKSSLIINEIRDYLMSTKNFWSSMPNSVCNMTLSPANDIGKAINNNNNNHLRRNSQNCFQEALEVYDINSDLRYRSEIQHQIHRLDFMQSRINEALNGNEIDWSKASDNMGAAIVPIDVQQPSNKPAQIIGSGQPQRPFESQHVTTNKPVVDEEDDTEDPMNPDEYDEMGSGDTTPDPEDDVDYPANSTQDEEEEIEPNEDVTTEDDTSSTTLPNDLTSDNPTPIIDNNSIEDQKQQMILNHSNELITADPSARKSGSNPGGLLIVIDNSSLLLVSIIYCALSVVIQNQFRPVDLIQN